jgi:hypothetical protein
MATDQLAGYEAQFHVALDNMPGALVYTARPASDCTQSLPTLFSVQITMTARAPTSSFTYLPLVSSLDCVRGNTTCCRHPTSRHLRISSRSQVRLPCSFSSALAHCRGRGTRGRR